MSSDSCDVPSKEDEELLLHSPDSNEKEIPSEMSKDQTDHSQPESDKLDSSELVNKDPDASEHAGQECGAKDPEPGIPANTNCELDSDDDEDMHLKWEDDETEEQAVSIDNIDKKIDGNDENLAENLLLEDSDDKIDVSMEKDRSETLVEKETDVIDDIDKLLNSDDDDNVILDKKNTNQAVATTSNSQTKVQNEDFDTETFDNEKDNSKDAVLVEESVEINNKVDKTAETSKNAEVDAEAESNLKGNKTDSLKTNTSVECIKDHQTTGSPNESRQSVDTHDHGLNRPDVMLEIPTQEIIDILDDSDISIIGNDTDVELNVKANSTEIDESIEMDQLDHATDVEAIETNSAVLDEKDPNNGSTIVSEDDWTEIERQLAGFETSLVKDSDSNDNKNPPIELTSKIDIVQSKKVEVPSDTKPVETIDAIETVDLGSPQIQIVSSTEKNKDTNVDKSIVPSESELKETFESSEPLPTSSLKSETSLAIEDKPIIDTTEISNKSQVMPSQDKLQSNIVSESLKSELDSNKDNIPIQISEKVPILPTSKISENLQSNIPKDSTTDVQILKSPNLDVEVSTTDIQDTESSKMDVDKTNVISPNVADVKSTLSSLKQDEITPNTSEQDLIKATEKVEPSVSTTKDEQVLACQSTREDVDTNPSIASNIAIKEKDIESSINPSQASKLNTKSQLSDQEIASTANLDTETASLNKHVEVQPSTSKDIEQTIHPSTSKDVSNEIVEEPPSKSAEQDHLAPDLTDEVSEDTDRLGLLAESSRMMEDDEEQEDEDEDYDDFYPEDESSNQMTADHSEDSNAQHSESDVAKEGKETDSPLEEKGKEEFNFPIETANVTEKEMGEDKDGNTDVEEVICEDDIEMTTEQVADAVTTAEDGDCTIESKDNENKLDQQKQEMETVKLSDTSDIEPEADTPLQEDTTEKGNNADNTTPSKPDTISNDNVNYVDLEGSSSEDDIQEVKDGGKRVKATDKGTTIEFEGSNVIIPAEVEVKSVPRTETTEADSTLKQLTTEPSETPQPESKSPEDKPKHKFSLEVFSLDSDEDEAVTEPPKPATPVVEIEKAVESNKCINLSCVYSGSVYYPADASTITYYDAGRKRKAMVCEQCADAVARRAMDLIVGIKILKPLLDLDICKVSSETVEISDSDSDEDTDDAEVEKEVIGEANAAFVEKELAKTINETWLKYKLDSRLTDAQQTLDEEMKRLEEETKEIDTLLNECQVATDKLRNDLYATFEQERHELKSLVIFDTPKNKYICMEHLLQEEEGPAPVPPTAAETRAKRRMSSASESAPKRPAIPLGYTPLDADKTQDSKTTEPVDTVKNDEDKDIAVLKVSVEAAPSDLPPPGELNRPPLRPDMCVYAMRNTFGSWSKAKVLEVQGKGQIPGATQNFTICRVKLFSRNQTKTKLLPARCLAYQDPADVRMVIGTRVIALFKDPMNEVKRETYYSGIIAEVPNPVNSYRYLVFFDDGYAQYVRHRDTRVVCECSPLVWEEVHPFSREFVRKYLIAYPERPMVRLHSGQSLKTEWNGKWWTSRVISVDASLVQVHFEEDNRTEWIYRGSTRLAPLFLELQAAERQRSRPMPRTKAQPRVNMPYVEYTRSDEQASKTAETTAPPTPAPITAQEREIRQRAVAKKSTAAPQAPTPTAHTDSVTSRVVYYTPKNAIKPYKMTPHSCGPHCKRKDTLALKDLRTYNPLAKPLLSGWERQILRHNGHKEVMYRAPCGRRLRNIHELHKYLRQIQSDMAVDLFDFTPHTHCLAEFVLNKCLVGKKDLSHGKENVPVPCVNYYDESLPEFCSYNTERTPTAGVPLNLDPDFLCGCDCTDDCVDKTKCACWKMTLEGARTIGLRGSDVGYVYKRLPDPLPSGIYECNSRCKCKQTCLNRVAQHPLQLKLQVFKTLNRGWGIRALNDVPKGSFLCVYAGNLLTDATANMDGLNEGDEYLAELDYIEVVEQMKEGYEEDIPDADKKLDKVHARKDRRLDKKSLLEPEEQTSSSDEEELPSKNEKEDGDFLPGHAIGMGVTDFSKRLRKRDKNKKEKEDGGAKEREGEKADEDCITISDDEEVREPARFMAEGMESNEFVSKYRSVRSYFGKDEACYIMDAKVQGNIGRYLNHSCMPNVFVQNVFVDTHDPRFPWVAFFALSHIKAGTELTWNYNYDVGSVPGKALYCYCGAPNCRGRLL